jgi:Ca-activated chloride channel family protein
LVNKIIDPALVEFIGYNLIRSSVFPIQARATQRITLSYEHILESDGDRIDYKLIRTESLGYSVPWNINAVIKAGAPISTVYSASHEMKLTRISPTAMQVDLTDKAKNQPGPLMMSYLLKDNDVTLSMYSYPDEKAGGGYFLILGGLPEELTADHKVQRELTIVIDTSGSMRGAKIEQVKEAALQIIAGLDSNDKFNIITYSNTVEKFSSAPVSKSKENEKKAERYIEAINANGGTNIYDALKTALDQETATKGLPMVLFLTDGLPTIGQTSELAIRELAVNSNPYNRRVFTFGVGTDVNAPLLDGIADKTKAKSEFVLPDEDIEVKIARTFRRLSGPIMIDPKMSFMNQNENAAVGRTRDVLPNVLGDIFEGDQVVILGQYIGSDPMHFQLTGTIADKLRTFSYPMTFKNAKVENGFIPRLWASRKIAQLIETIRQSGADSGTAPSMPELRELVQEIVRLSTEFGILTEYTAFLAREGTNMSDAEGIFKSAETGLDRRARGDRSGTRGVNQSFNYAAQRRQSILNMRNRFYDENMRQVENRSIQQINDRAYYNRHNRWIESSIVNRKESQLKPDRTIKFGSDEYFELAEELAKTNRQGTLAMPGELLIIVNDQIILIKP